MGKIYLAAPAKKSKKKVRKPKRRQFQTVLRPNPGTGIPPVMFLKLKYCELVTMGPGTINSQLYRGNGIYRPDYTNGTAHQPYLSDQFARFYNRYTVYASKIKIDVGTDAAVDGRVVIRPSNSSATVSDFDLSVERPYSKNQTFSPDKRAKLSHYMKTKNIIGVNDIDDDDYAGTLSSTGPTADPTSLWFWTIATAPTDDSTLIKTPIQVEIIYYVKFWQRVNQASS